MEIKKEDIVTIECKHIAYCPPNDGSLDDVHLVKEILHMKDGSLIPNIRFIKNFKREFGITKENYRKHKEKKEGEDLSKLNFFKSNQVNLMNACAKALGKPGFKGTMKQLARSPYLYGTDISSSALIKKNYMNHFTGKATTSKVAMYDTETNVFSSKQEIIIATIALGNKVRTFIDKKFLAGYADIENRLRQALVKYLGDYVEKRNMVWEIVFLENDVEIAINSLKTAHEWMPDFLAIWNMDFDITKLLESLERGNIDPALVFSDPKVPNNYKSFKYSRSPDQKVTASGKITPIKPHEKWHVVDAPSSFYIIDAMCAYKRIRLAKPDEPSYSLDNILAANLGVRKLKFKEADRYVGLEWHKFMQKNYPIEYVIYNVFDCVGMQELDEKTRDLELSLPNQSGCSDFATFKSQPRRVCDDLHFFMLEKGRMIGTTSDQMEIELDSKTIGLEDWIVMLPAFSVADNGLRNIKDAPDIITNIRRDTGDLDVSASYPNGGAALNISKETTSKELIDIEGVSEKQRRAQGINLSAGYTNAVEFCCEIFSAPTLTDLLVEFDKESTVVNI